LVKSIDEKVQKNPSLKSFVVITPKSGEKPADELKKLAQDGGVKHVPLTVGESPDGPPDYEISRNADYTVLMWTHHKVVVNRAYKGDLTDKDRDEIVADISKLLGK
jgi:hypothetical protein